MLAAIPFLAFAGNWEMAAALIIVERIGKAIRTPARDTILSHATMAVGRGWGFGVHKALDQIGAVAGPLVIFAALVVTGGYMDGFLVLALPLIGVAVALFLARSAVPSPRFLEVEEKRGNYTPSILPYAIFIFLGMAGFATFPLMSFHLKAQAIVSDATIPLFYAGAMVVSVFVALLLGRVFDRLGSHILLAILIISLATVLLAFSADPRIVVAGSFVWGAGIGIFEPVLRASIAEFTSLERRGEVYGTITAVYGTAWFVGSAVMGVLYDLSFGHLITYVVLVEAAALVAYLWLYRSRIPIRPGEGPGDIVS